MEIQISFTIGEGIESAKSKKISGVTEIVMLGFDMPLIAYKFNDVQHPNQMGSQIPHGQNLTPEMEEQYQQQVEDEQIHYLETLLQRAHEHIDSERATRRQALDRRLIELQREEQRRQANTLDRMLPTTPNNTEDPQ